MRRRLLAAVTLAGLAGAVLAVSAWAALPSGTAARKPHVQHVAFTVVSLGRGAMGNEVAPVANIAIAPGVPVRVTVTNPTHLLHTFTVPGLHVNVPILPARGDTPRKTTFMFVARESGAFIWRCLVCVGQHHKHAMSGTIYAIIDPSLFP